jgi:hypothetical protein
VHTRVNIRCGQINRLISEGSSHFVCEYSRRKLKEKRCGRGGKCGGENGFSLAWLREWPPRVGRLEMAVTA